MRLTIFILLLQTLSIYKIYSQNNGLLKNETITTYWGSNEKQIRSVGTIRQVDTQILVLKLVRFTFTKMEIFKMKVLIFLES